MNARKWCCWKYSWNGDESYRISLRVVYVYCLFKYIQSRLDTCNVKLKFVESVVKTDINSEIQFIVGQWEIMLFYANFILFFESNMVLEHDTSRMENSSPATIGASSSNTRSGHVIFTHSLSVKLTNENFLLCSHQVLTSIKGQRLMHFIKGSLKPS